MEKKCKETHKLILLLGIILFPKQALGQVLDMRLDQCIEIAVRQSPEVLKHKHAFLSSYWLYKAYQAGLKPQAVLQTTPIEYSRTFIKRYDYTQNIDIYRPQRYWTTSLGLSVSQTIPFTGGTLTLSSGLDYIRNIGTDNNEQYSTVPVSLGYSQSLFGYNPLKWSKKIEPLKYQIARQKYIYAMESTILETVNRFFDLALLQEEHRMASETLRSCDSLYAAGKERYKMSAISKADLLALQVDLINAENASVQIAHQKEEALSSFLLFLQIDKPIDIKLEIPPLPKISSISPQKAVSLMQTNNPNVLEAHMQVRESEQDLERIRKTTGVDASFSVGIGFNKAAGKFHEAYSHLPRQDYFSMSIKVPILDWGAGKSKRNAAKSNLEQIKVSVNQNIEDLKEKVWQTTLRFNQNKILADKAKKAFQMALSSYQIYKSRFILGKEDVSAVTLSLNRQQEAQRNYQQALSDYWTYYYTIRTLTLYDFEKEENLTYALPVY